MAADPCESMGKDKNNTPVVNGRRMYKKNNYQSEEKTT